MTAAKATEGASVINAHSISPRITVSTAAPAGPRSYRPPAMRSDRADLVAGVFLGLMVRTGGVLNALTDLILLINGEMEVPQSGVHTLNVALRRLLGLRELAKGVGLRRMRTKRGTNLSEIVTAGATAQ
ncbi:hypothetical protein ACFV9W_31825 [Streptomyces sp. NPDC059897]|uniref:hypothetical protein n=1 Tax=Streptomyces sp. NPDC059897 TaxID=3346994 RepID=UPI003667D927